MAHGHWIALPSSVHATNKSSLLRERGVGGDQHEQLRTREPGAHVTRANEELCVLSRDETLDLLLDLIANMRLWRFQS